MNPELAPELPVDREQGLALQFDDPGIAELLPLMSGEEPAAPAVDAAAEPAPSLTAEVAEAVQELVFDLNAAADAAPETASAYELVSEEASADVGFEFGEVPESSVAAIDNNPALDFDLSAEMAEAEFAPDEAPLVMSQDATEMLTIEGTGIETAHNIARIQVADRMFDLIVCEKSFNDLAETLLSTLMKASAGTAGSILELDHGRNEFFFRAVFGSNDPDKVKAFRVPVGKGIVGHVAESRQPLLLNDMEGDERQLRAISMSTGLEIVTCMALPLLITNRLYGVVEVFNKAGGGRFDKADLQLMEDSTRMAAKVLEVRFLMAELLRKVR
jgi:GAF domain-containing protein